MTAITRQDVLMGTGVVLSYIKAGISIGFWSFNLEKSHQCNEMLKCCTHAGKSRQCSQAQVRYEITDVTKYCKELPSADFKNNVQIALTSSLMVFFLGAALVLSVVIVRELFVNKSVLKRCYNISSPRQGYTNIQEVEIPLKRLDSVETEYLISKMQ